MIEIHNNLISNNNNNISNKDNKLPQAQSCLFKVKELEKIQCPKVLQ